MQCLKSEAAAVVNLGQGAQNILPVDFPLIRDQMAVAAEIVVIEVQRFDPAAQHTDCITGILPYDTGVAGINTAGEAVLILQAVKKLNIFLWI